MKLNESTIKNLKSLAELNPRLFIKKGNVQKNLKEDKTVFAQFKLEDEFPMSFRIYDLNKFIGNIELLNNPEIDFHDTYCEIKDDECIISYKYAAEGLVQELTTKELVLTDPDVTFNLNEKLLAKILKISTINGFEYITIEVADSVLSLVGMNDSKSGDGSGSDSVRIIIDSSYKCDDFKIVCKIENLKNIIMDSYAVTAKRDAFAVFENESKTKKYLVVTERGRSS